jgi:hypothetical protein
MKPKLLLKLQSEDPVVNKLQDQLKLAVNPVLLNPLISGHLLEDVELTANAQTIVQHKLGRTLKGWMICRQDELAGIYDMQADNATPDKTLSLVSTTDVTVSLWVF